MRTRTLQIVVFVLLIAPVGGCLKWETQPGGDPNSAAGPRRRLVVDPNAAARAEAGAEAAAGLLPLLGPAGGTAATLLLAGLGIWRRKVRPALESAQTQAEQSHAATAATVAGIEDWKREHPQEWQALETKIKEQIDRAGADPKAIENIIRAIRGLPAKA